MKFRLYKNFGALNSPPIFAAFEQGVKRAGHEIVESGEDVAVIWSVLWSGRMANNQLVYNDCISKGKPIIIIEVGNLRRGNTWRICLDNINNLGIFGNIENLDPSRPQKLGVSLKPLKINRQKEILIATQHSQSLQWKGQLPMETWIKDTVYKIRSLTDLPVVVRPHPRAGIRVNLPGVKYESPKKIPGTYDDFDIDYNFHCIINHNSGPGVQSVIHGTPVICDSSSLAFPMSEKWENLKDPQLANRDEWFLKLTHTEWTVDEIAQGIPIQRLEKNIQEKLATRP